MFRINLLVACVAVLCGMGAWAQDYPVRPVRLVTMFAPGSASDQHARFLSHKLTEQLGQQVLVYNKGGAGGLLATREVLRAQPVSVALLAGEIQAYFATVNTARTRMRSPQIRGLAVTAEQRSAVLPDIPTFKEQGYPAMVEASWTGVFVPSVAPAATQDMKAMLERQEFEPWGGTLEQFMANARAEGAALAVDYKRLNIPVLD